LHPEEQLFMAGWLKPALREERAEDRGSHWNWPILSSTVRRTRFWRSRTSFVAEVNRAKPREEACVARDWELS